MPTRCVWYVHKWAKRLRLQISFWSQLHARQGKHSGCSEQARLASSNLLHTRLALIGTCLSCYYYYDSGENLTNICMPLVWQHADLHACMLLCWWQCAVKETSAVPASSGQQSQDLWVNCNRTLQSMFIVAGAKLLMWLSPVQLSHSQAKTVYQQGLREI